MAESPVVQFRARDELGQAIADRVEHGNYTQIAIRDLERYYYLLRLQLPQFSEGEASLLCDTLNGSINQPQTAALLWAQVDDAVRAGLAEKWDVDGKALVERLRQLTPFECMAVEDAVERFWTGPYRQTGTTMAEKLRQVGLVWNMEMHERRSESL